MTMSRYTLSHDVQLSTRGMSSIHTPAAKSSFQAVAFTGICHTCEVVGLYMSIYAWKRAPDPRSGSMPCRRVLLVGKVFFRDGNVFHVIHLFEKAHHLRDRQKRHQVLCIQVRVERVSPHALTAHDLRATGDQVESPQVFERWRVAHSHSLNVREHGRVHTRASVESPLAGERR